MNGSRCANPAYGSGNSRLAGQEIGLARNVQYRPQSQYEEDHKR